MRTAQILPLLVLVAGFALPAAARCTIDNMSVPTECDGNGCIAVSWGYTASTGCDVSFYVDRRECPSGSWTEILGPQSASNFEDCPGEGSWEYRIRMYCGVTCPTTEKDTATTGCIACE